MSLRLSFVLNFSNFFFRFLSVLSICRRSLSAVFQPVSSVCPYADDILPVSSNSLLRMVSLCTPSTLCHPLDRPLSCTALQSPRSRTAPNVAPRFNAAYVGHPTFVSPHNHGTLQRTTLLTTVSSYPCVVCALWGFKGCRMLLSSLTSSEIDLPCGRQPRAHMAHRSPKDPFSPLQSPMPPQRAGIGVELLRFSSANRLSTSPCWGRQPGREYHST